MKFYISTTGIKRVTISNPGAGKAPHAASTAPRRISTRSILPLLLTLAIVLPFFFVRVAFLVLESAAACSSTLGNYAPPAFELCNLENGCTDLILLNVPSIFLTPEETSVLRLIFVVEKKTLDRVQALFQSNRHYSLHDFR